MEIHCDIPQDQAVRAQKKNDQLGQCAYVRFFAYLVVVTDFPFSAGGLSNRKGKGLKNRDPNKIVDQNNSSIVKPQQGSVSINLENQVQRC
jgi:hypothetical protein